MESRALNVTPLLLAFGILSFGLAGVSIVDMFFPRPYDGVVLDADYADSLVVGEVIPGSGADRAGISQGDTILGIGRVLVRNSTDAARRLNDFRIGASVPYLVQSGAKREEINVELGRRRLGDGIYFYSCTLGFSFFFVGLFVLVRQPTLRASQIFFLLCGLFMLFLVCRMRPASYSGVDSLLLAVGTVAFTLLPPAFLHFYLLFPRPAWLEALRRRPRWQALVSVWRSGWPLLYVVPILVYWGSLLYARMRDQKVPVLNGAPVASWWLLAIFVVLGFAALVANFRFLRNPRERRGMALVLTGSFFGLMPFLISTLVAAHQQSQTFLLFGVLPLALVPLTFAYAIVRFQLLDIRVILRRSLLYTVTTALVTGLYAGGIATFNALFKGSALAASRSFPIVLALAIILLFDPFRRRVQEVIDRFFFASRSRLERAMVELGEAVTAQVDLQTVVKELVEKLPQLLGVRFAALYLVRGDRLKREAGPTTLPASLPVLPELERFLRKRSQLTRLDQLGSLPLRSHEVARMVDKLTGVGVGAIGELASRRRHVGMVLLATHESRLPLERDELDLLQRLLHQAALALETSLLLEERTQQAELERELEIAATIQAQLLPAELRFAAGWEVSASCLPARIVGGDFYSQLPSQDDNGGAVIYGDVSGKSVSGALVMMAAHEALYTLAMTQPQPADLFALTNRRLYALGNRSFVALGYFCASADGRRLRYLVAGQPAPLLRRRDGEVSELPLSEHRVPVGALQQGEYRDLEIDLEPGDVVLGYSDGVTDARSPDGDFFGESRLRDVVAAAPASPSSLVDQVLAAVRDFSHGGLQYDDLTLVAVGRSSES